MRGSQRGQVLVIFAGGLITLLLLAALVVDLGFAWLIQRHEQNAADTGAIAAARYIHPPGGGAADTGAMFAAACFYARQNGFFPLATDNGSSATGCVTANDPNGTALAVHYPPSIAAGQHAGDPAKVEVQLARPHQTLFSRVIGQLVINVASGAVAAFDTGDSGSSSLIALDPTECRSGQITGNSTVTIQPVIPGTNGGYIQINSECTSGDADNDVCTNDGNGSFMVTGGAQVTAPQLYTRGNCALNGTSTFTGNVTETAQYVGDPLASLRPPPVSPTGAYCNWTSPTTGTNQTGPTGNAAKGCTFNGASTIDLYPGTYYGGWKVTGKPIIRLHPGIYVIAGGGITLNTQDGSLFESVAGPGGSPDDARVLIFSTDNPAASCPGGAAHLCQGDITFSANTALDLKGLNSSPCPPVSTTGCPYAGLVIWQDANASNLNPQVNISAGSSLSLAGTIYNANGLVDLTGSSSTSGCTVGAATQNCAAIQIVSWQFNINGGAGLVIPYDPNGLYHLMQKGLVK
jgi:Flp pilus assembly protein TadG